MSVDRIQEAKDLLEIMGAITKLKDGVYLVASQWNSDKSYIVDLAKRDCSCPDHLYRGGDCKHILAVKAFTERAKPKDPFDLSHTPLSMRPGDWGASTR